jgi:hypothetical protein
MKNMHALHLELPSRRAKWYEARFFFLATHSLF